MRALDESAWRCRQQDAELRAALFRFVDVTPACRSLDELARHLAGYLEEVDEKPPPLAGGDADGRIAARAGRRSGRRPPPA